VFGSSANPLRGDPRLDNQKPSYRFLGDLDTVSLRLLKTLRKYPVPGFGVRLGADSLMQAVWVRHIPVPFHLLTPVRRVSSSAFLPAWPGR